MHETLILTRGDVAAAMDLASWLEAVETGFAASARGDAWSPLPMHVEGAGGAFHAKGAGLKLPEGLFVALKLNANFPANPAERGLPTIQGALLLHDGSDGRLLAVIDSIELTIRRTAAATALAARYLARPDSCTVLVCGCGEQGRAQLEALCAVLPLERAFAWDIDAGRAAIFAAENGERLGLETTVSDLASAAAQADAIVTCTTAREPFLTRAMIKPGTFVAGVGADSPSKSELHPDLFDGTLVVADVLAQCAEMGDLRHALATGSTSLDRVHSELADLVSGARPGRTSDEEITVFDSTGTALQDVAAAAMVYWRCTDRPAGRRVAFGGGD
jgi:alanine dehydrogenase